MTEFEEQVYSEAQAYDYDAWLDAEYERAYMEYQQQQFEDWLADHPEYWDEYEFEEVE